MKTHVKHSLLLILLCLTGLVHSQGTTTPVNDDSIVGTLRLNGINAFEVVPLQPDPLDSFAYYTHLWWSGDNCFSFAAKPIHMHYPSKYYVKFPKDIKMTAIPTENYGSGGPPPLTYKFETAAGNRAARTPVLPSGTNLYVQRYRNAVIDDVMYLIVSYTNPVTSPNGSSGILSFDFGDYAEFDDRTYNDHLHFFPNGETWNASAKTVSFTDLATDEERSILIPVKILPNEKDSLQISVRLQKHKSDLPPNPIEGVHIFTLNPEVAKSHDPNIMHQRSGAKDKCDYRNGKIHYTIKFQNTGKGKTRYIRVECSLDDKVDLDQITDIVFPEKFMPRSQSNQALHFREGTVLGHWQDNYGAVYEKDSANNKIIFEMHNIHLQGTGDLNVPHLELTRDQIEFDIRVKSNYVFGPPTIAYSEIYFDGHAPIRTGTVETTCSRGEGQAGYPVREGYGIEDGYGGFQPDKKRNWWDRWKWLVISAGALATLGLGISLWKRRGGSPQ